MNEFPLIHPLGSKGARKCEENRLKIEKAILSSDKFPAVVKTFNFTRKAVNGKTAARAVCDLYIEKYLSEEGKFPVGTILRERSIHSIIDGKGVLRGHPLSIPASKGKINLSTRGVKKNKINLKYINQLCQEKKLPYRAFSLNRRESTESIVFWHPEFGYSSSQLRHWLKEPESRNPFHQFLIDKEIINKVNLILFDNGLQDTYEVLSEAISYCEYGIKRIPIFCKLHGLKIYSSLGNIEKGLWFNCPKCKRVDFDNIRKIQRLKRGEIEDKGSSVVALMRLEIDGIKTLKFGISSTRSINSSDEIVLKNRYKGNLKKVIYSYRCNSELEARKLEQSMLNETRELRNYKIPSSFGGYSECRDIGKIQQSICERAFFAAIEADKLQS